MVFQLLCYLEKYYIRKKSLRATYVNDFKSDTTCSKGQKEDFLLQNNLQKIHINKLAKKTVMYMLVTFFIKQTPTFVFKLHFLTVNFKLLFFI